MLKIKSSFIMLPFIFKVNVEIKKQRISIEEKIWHQVICDLGLGTLHSKLIIKFLQLSHLYHRHQSHPSEPSPLTLVVPTMIRLV